MTDEQTTEKDSNIIIGCDGDCFNENAECYRLSTGGDEAVILCRGCWAKEMRWRKTRNEDLEDSCKFPILPFPGDDN